MHSHRHETAFVFITAIRWSRPGKARHIRGAPRIAGGRCATARRLIGSTNVPQVASEQRERAARARFASLKRFTT
jgi:hypothetical protein